MSNATAHYWEEKLSEQTKLPLQNIFSQVQLSLCSNHETKTRYPLIFFSPGAEAPSEWYSILTTNLAAQGYVVVQVGVPGEISFIQFPDGHIQNGYLNQTDPIQLAIAQEIRVKDISFVLDRLLSNSPSEDISCINANIDTRSPSVFGHSLGGSTALATLIADQRFVAGANADGSFWGEALSKSTDRPFLMLGSTPGYTKSLSTVPNWAEVWPHLRGPKWLVSVRNSVHRSFINVNLIAEYLGLFSMFPELSQFLGEVDPQEMLRIQVALLSEMGKLSSGVRVGQLLNITEVAGSFQQVDILNKSLPGSD